ncbi:MAG: hypothetical protein KBT03_07975 [Bacteroidales bacterium]|nr:hypothetical protein [Candidatus Scybalousia scybalohippi]
MADATKLKARMDVVYERDIPIETGDYEKLTNLPSINGVKLIGDINLADLESDPHVPEWAKDEKPPTAEETGAVSVDAHLTNEDIDEMFE